MESGKQSDEHIFLEGPQARRKESLFVLKVVVDFLRGFRKFHFVGPCVTVFGSARFKSEHPYYKLAMQIGGKLAGMGFTVMTGGGPGIMEAANRGAREAGGKSVGCNIKLSHEQKPNKYLDHWVNIKYFFVRKILLTKYSYAFVVMPGGYGTLDEFFESITLIQTEKMGKFPVVMVGTEYHQNLYAHLQNLVKQGTIDAKDIDLFLFTDDVDEAMKHIADNTIERFKLHPALRPKWWLGEKILSWI